MSRVGRKIIKIPTGVKVNLIADSIQVQGPKGTLSTPIPADISFELNNGELVAKRKSDSKRVKALHGLARALVANSITGVTEGFKKELDLVGIGYKAEVKGKSVVFSLGYSHPIEFLIPEGITIKVEKLTKTLQNYIASITISGSDKQKIGQIAADIRSFRPPDSYKGKGIRYADEVVKLKVGKKGA